MYTVSEAAEILKIPASTIRFYDKNGLLPNISRSQGGIRLFAESDIELLREIISLREWGFSVKEIARYVELEETESGQAERLSMLEERRKAIDAELERLEKVKKLLEEKCGFYNNK